MKPFDHKLMLITDRKACRTGSLEESIRQAIAAGVGCIQLREKGMERDALLKVAQTLADLCRAGHASLIINSDAEMVLQVNAQGVHLPASGPPTSEMRTIIAENRWIGRSVHSLEEAVRGEEEGADYILYGPVFETPSKRPYGPPLGTRSLGKVTARLKIPVLAVGGINLNNMDEVVEGGAWGVAVIRAILSSENITKTASSFRDTLKRVGKV